MREYLHNWKIWLTHTINVITGGKASEDFSSRCYRRQKNNEALSLCRRAIDTVFGDDHCYQSYLHESERLEAYKRH
jgi:hypothetical protein